MGWVESCPQLQVSIPYKEPILKIEHVPNSLILVLLTKSSIHLYNQYTLLPISSYKRSEESLTQHGLNVDLKARFGKWVVTNSFFLILQTDKSYIEIIQLTKGPKELYEISKNDDIIQSGLPLTNSNKSSLTEMIKSATKSIITGNNSTYPNLENIENDQNMDDVLNFHIDYYKITVIKLLKIGMGIDKFWLKQNSKSLIIYNNINERDGVEDNYFQIISTSTFKNQLVQLSTLKWYASNSQILFIDYNKYQHYFLFVNQLNELWYLRLDKNKDGDIDIIGHKLHSFSSDIVSMATSFNPVNDLVILNINDEPKLFKLADNTLTYLKTLNSTGMISWFPDGEYYYNIDEQTSYWKIFTKFGNCYFDSRETFKEVDDGFEPQLFLTASTIKVSENSQVLYLIDKTGKFLYYFRLLSISNGIFYSHEYLTIVRDKKFLKFPLSPLYKNLVLTSNKKLNISKSVYNQFCITQGEHLSISTPFNTGGDIINQVLWFNFKNFEVDTFNIVFHVWFKDYLILVNRRESDDDPNIYVDEIVVIDCQKSKYGSGGHPIKFDSDLVISKYEVNSTVIVLAMNNNKLVIVTWDYRLIIFDFSGTEDQSSYRLFIKVNKTIQLSTIQNRFAIRNSVELAVQENNFLFLLNTGELYLLKNFKNMYDLIKINFNIEWINLNRGHFYACSGEKMLIYKDLSFGASTEIEIDNFLPLEINENLDLIGIESLVVNNNGALILKNRVVSKLILNNVIENDLVVEEYPNLKKYEQYRHFNYSLELILVRYLTGDKRVLLNKLIKLIEYFQEAESIYINCLRKIEVGYWEVFFEILNVKPIEFMNRLIKKGDVELCYQFLIVYLNSKKEGEEFHEDLSTSDCELVLVIIKMLAESGKWEWCYELCRFIKLLDPTNEILNRVKVELG